MLNSKLPLPDRASMEPKDKVELINRAIRKLIEEKNNNKDASSQDDDQLLLSKLLSQLDSLEADGVLKQPGGITEIKEATSAAGGEVETKGENAGQGGVEAAEISRDEVVNELRYVKRQNFITHCLLSVMIVLTAAWQLSEVKLILKLKDGLNHPFRSVGSLLTGMLKPPVNNGQDAEESNQIEAQPLIPLKIPELLHIDLPELGLNGERH